MVYKFRIISDEVDDFLREIKIDSDASFYDLHEAILKCTNYKNDQMERYPSERIAGRRKTKTDLRV